MYTPQRGPCCSPLCSFRNQAANYEESRSSYDTRTVCPPERGTIRPASCLPLPDTSGPCGVWGKEHNETNKQNTVILVYLLKHSSPVRMGNCNSCDIVRQTSSVGTDAARLCGCHIETEGQREKCGSDSKYSNWFKR